METIVTSQAPKKLGKITYKNEKCFTLNWGDIPENSTIVFEKAYFNEYGFPLLFDPDTNSEFLVLMKSSIKKLEENQKMDYYWNIVFDIVTKEFNYIIIKNVKFIDNHNY